MHTTFMRKYGILCGLLFFWGIPFWVSAQSDSLLQEVVVSAYKEQAYTATSLNIVPLSIKEKNTPGSYTLTDALTEVPGVRKLSQGTGIAKPVVRGLYGSRLLVLFGGLRFDNQQWQDEHGLGLSSVGVDRVELIKGPLSVLYGTNAVGGVINILGTTKAKPGTTRWEGKLSTHSNTGGIQFQGGYREHEENHWLNLLGGVENYADYTDGNGDRVTNSRFNGYYFVGNYGRKKGRWTSDNSYHFSYNNFGFVLSDDLSLLPKDERWSRAMNGPHQIVMLNLLNSRNTFDLSGSQLEFNAGLQSNYRAEDEGGGSLSLIMHLLTAQYAAKWHKALGNNRELVLANVSRLVSNKNYGKRKIVPDAYEAESNLSAYYKQSWTQHVLEAGVGLGSHYVKTLLTPSVNAPGKELGPLSQQRPFISGMFGYSWNPNRQWNLKLNLATGTRAPNMAELSSDGLHEGVYTYEIGNPDLRNEQNYNTDLALHYFARWIQVSLDGFYNYFHGYIYLNPTSEQWFGFPVYRYAQQDAYITGGEGSIKLYPQNNLKGLSLGLNYSGLVGKTTAGPYLPYMPAQLWKPEIRYNKTWSEKWKGYGFTNVEFLNNQNLIAPAEQPSDGYTLLNAGVGVEMAGDRAHYTIALSGKNLLNVTYYDHLSRYKNFGLYNMGRDVTLTLKIQFEQSIN